MLALSIPILSIQEPKGLVGQIKLLVPSDGLNGALLMWIDYEVDGNTNCCNRYSLLKIKPVYFYDHTKVRHIIEDEHAFDLALIPKVLEYMSLVSSYFKFAMKFMDDHRLPPPSFEYFLQTSA